MACSIASYVVPNDISKKIHMSANGDTIIVSDMSDTHLKNTIKLIITKIEDARHILGGGYAISDTKLVTSIDMIGMGINQEALVNKMTQIIKSNLDRLPIYIYEASIRGMDFSNELQGIHGRSIKTDMKRIYDMESNYLELEDQYGESTF